MTGLKSVLLDTYALIAYFQDEPGAEKVARYMADIESGKIRGFISCVTITEILSRLGTINPEKAYMIISYIEQSPVQICPIWYIESRRAGELKVKYKHLELSTADALIIASAMLNKVGEIVTGDEAWKHVEEIKVVEI